MAGTSMAGTSMAGTAVAGAPGGAGPTAGAAAGTMTAGTGPTAGTPAAGSMMTAGTIATGGIGGVGGVPGVGGAAGAAGIGMAGAGGAVGTAGTPATGNTPMETICNTVATFPPPMYDPAQTIAWWENFVNMHPNRQMGKPQNKKAGMLLRDELMAAGYEAKIITLGGVDIVEGIKRGRTKPDNYLGIISHYDVVDRSPGAYDDGSGVAVSLQICKNLAAVPTNKSIACLFFDGEERGKLGSAAYIKEFVRGSNPKKKFDHGFGYDMVGLDRTLDPDKRGFGYYAFLGFDKASKLRQHLGPNRKLAQHVLYDCPKGQTMTTRMELKLRDRNTRNSDEANFEQAGIPTFRMAGLETASTYPAYHKVNDTPKNIYMLAGGNPEPGRTNYQKGLALAISLSHYVILAYDQWDYTSVPK